jgi:predicted MFS family arabinose efflux permease
VGSGIAVYGPAWQASAAEMVGPEALPAAVALYSTSSNVARSFGPALGGGIIASFGIFAAFSVNAALYVPIIIALYLWRRQATPPRLPPERLDRSIIAGLRFVRHAPPIRRILVRTLGLSIGGAATYSMMPLVARRLLNGGPGTYGVLLGAFGIGAVTAALNIGTIRRYHEPDRIVAFSGVAMGGAILVAAVSRFMPLTAFAMMIAGAGWLLSLTQFNVSLQLFAPRWVSGRAVATFQSVCAAGLAGGAWLWGHIAQAIGVQNALLCAAAWMMLVPLLCWLLPIARIDPTETLAITPSGDPVVLLDITGRSGPIVLEIDYSVDPQNARKFYHLIRQIQRRRERDGAYDVSIARDLENPTHWIERFQYPTWHDYLRSRDRATVADRSMREEVQALQRSPEFPRAQRFLERPFGSVRWRDDAHDTGTEKPGSLGVLH